MLARAGMLQPFSVSTYLEVVDKASIVRVLGHDAIKGILEDVLAAHQHLKLTRDLAERHREQGGRSMHASRQGGEPGREAP